MVLQLEVAGSHTVTLVNRVFVEGVEMPLSVETEATLAPAPEGNTVMSTTAVEPGFRIELAVSVTGTFPVTVAGAAYVADVVVEINVPLPKAGESDQVTPWPASPVTVAFTIRAWPWLIVCGPTEESATATVGKTPI